MSTHPAPYPLRPACSGTTAWGDAGDGSFLVYPCEWESALFTRHASGELLAVVRVRGGPGLRWLRGATAQRLQMLMNHELPVAMPLTVFAKESTDVRPG